MESSGCFVHRIGNPGWFEFSFRHLPRSAQTASILRATRGSATRFAMTCSMTDHQERVGRTDRGAIPLAISGTHHVHISGRAPIVQGAPHKRPHVTGQAHALEGVTTRVRWVHTVSLAFELAENTR
jgi:hypothetical protein